MSLSLAVTVTTLSAVIDVTVTVTHHCDNVACQTSLHFTFTVIVIFVVSVVVVVMLPFVSAHLTAAVLCCLYSLCLSYILVL